MQGGWVSTPSIHWLLVFAVYILIMDNRIDLTFLVNVEGDMTGEF
jgi:hypothetical protein